MVFVQLSSGVHNISNCMVFGKHFWGSTVAAMLGPQEHLQGLWLGTKAGSGGCQSWWCTHSWLQESAALAGDVAEAGCRHA